MTFEDELQLLVDKYGLEQVEFSYRKKTVLSARQVIAVGNGGSPGGSGFGSIGPNIGAMPYKDPVGHVDEQVDPEEATRLAQYLGGPVGKIK